MLTTKMHTEKKAISLIVAGLLPKFGIGFEGQLPWKLKREMRYFRLVTSTAVAGKKNAVIMGRKTWQSIPPKFRPLPNRINVVLSRTSSSNAAIQEEVEGSDTVIADSMSSAIRLLDSEKIDQIFVIGGAELYNQLLSLPETEDYSVENIFLTEITSDKDHAMDAFIQMDNTQWRKASSAALQGHLEKYELTGFELENNEEGDYKYDFTLWQKIK
ncbi:unnamed protein product [Kuraishia capsulata CBS 1993]|uniref:Dihydrofolate reductase n=1 Tax=Kuraishia capsulata CBS 1993 TaxID=1382522 RepID=W6ML01_9ASCO|nr:uncharacterized protein KUCA_T00002732001 [Kuraishia capsulata CBS 1993]CDK26758.1 unnamed protein product [Kuraishia capsulata CBS 1993]